MQPTPTVPLSFSEASPSGPEPLTAQGPDADEQEKKELIAWYSSPEFTRRLLEHMHKAKKKAILESQEQRDQ